MADSTGNKPAKPTPDYPLFAHQTGRWAKKIRGRTVYFGPWSDPDGALVAYEQQRADLEAGRAPRCQVSKGVSPAGVTTGTAAAADQPTRPAKPRADFPLFAHASGRWAKKIKGVTRYFGSWDDPQAALDLYNKQKDDLYAGRKPRGSSGDGLAIRDLCNRFQTAKTRKMEAGELEYRTWLEYKTTCDRVISEFSKTRPVDDLAPEDFEAFRAKLAKSLGPVALGNEIQRVRCLFKYGFDNHLLDRPVRFGSEFRKPSKKIRRLARQRRGAVLLTADEIKLTIAKAPRQLRAMIWLGLNCGFGNTDCSSLPIKAIDFKAKMIDYPRPKTGVERRAPLWPETVAALKEALEHRYEPTDPADAGILFITKQRNRWSRHNEEVRVDSIAREFGKLLREHGIKKDGERFGTGFYALRHTFETIAGETGDQAAVDRIMGHERDDMATVYREWLKDDRENARLKKVTDHVRRWLAPSTKRAGKRAKNK